MTSPDLAIKVLCHKQGAFQLGLVTMNYPVKFSMKKVEIIVVQLHILIHVECSEDVRKLMYGRGKQLIT